MARMPHGGQLACALRYLVTCYLAAGTIQGTIAAGTIQGTIAAGTIQGTIATGTIQGTIATGTIQGTSLHLGPMNHGSIRQTHKTTQIMPASCQHHGSIRQTHKTTSKQVKTLSAALSTCFDTTNYSNFPLQDRTLLTSALPCSLGK